MYCFGVDSTRSVVSGALHDVLQGPGAHGAGHHPTEQARGLRQLHLRREPRAAVHPTGTVHSVHSVHTQTAFHDFCRAKKFLTGFEKKKHVAWVYAGTGNRKGNKRL